MKKIELEVAKCADCPYLDLGMDLCNKADRYIWEPEAIPDWCPLPDVEGK